MRWPDRPPPTHAPPSAPTGYLARHAENIAELLDLPGSATCHDQVLVLTEERCKMRQYRQPLPGNSRGALEARLPDPGDDKAGRSQVAKWPSCF